MNEQQAITAYSGTWQVDCNRRCVLLLRYDDPTIALNCGSMYRDCIRDEALARWACSKARKHKPASSGSLGQGASAVHHDVRVDTLHLSKTLISLVYVASMARASPQPPP